MPPNTTIRYRNNLRHENDVLQAEIQRLYILLADTARCAATGQPFSPTDLLAAIAARRGFNLARGHYYDQPPTTQELVLLLKSTNGRPKLEAVSA
jgi:hypothetical protein